MQSLHWVFSSASNQAHFHETFHFRRMQPNRSKVYLIHSTTPTSNKSLSKKLSAPNTDILMKLTNFGGFARGGNIIFAVQRSSGSGCRHRVFNFSDFHSRGRWSRLRWHVSNLDAAPRTTRGEPDLSGGLGRLYVCAVFEEKLGGKKRISWILTFILLYLKCYIWK